MPRKKQALTLLEILISLVLFAIILSSLFTTYRQLVRHKTTTAHLQRESFEHELVFQKLDPLLAQVTGDPPSTFHTENNSLGPGHMLVFAYRNRLDPDPLFCTDLTCFLFLDPSKRLCLKTQTQSGVERVEYLADPVASITYSFFNPKTLEWQSEWPSKNPLPPFFKIEWHTSRPVTRAFFLPHATQLINYPLPPIPES